MCEDLQRQDSRPSASSHLDAGEPLSDGGEALLSRDVVHHNYAIDFAKKLFGDASISAAQSRFIAGWQRLRNLQSSSRFIRNDRLLTAPVQLYPKAAAPPGCRPQVLSLRCNRYLHVHT